MSKSKVAIVGISGRMGRELQALASELGLLVTAGVVSKAGSINGPSVDGSISIVSKIEDLKPQLFELVIDFSLPEATQNVVAWCLKHKKPLVSGVTGISEEARNSMQKAAQEIAILWAANMSLGVAVLARAARSLAALEGFDFQIEEVHHRHKKDKPSGTALVLQKDLEEAVGRVIPQPVAIRGGGVFGIHRIFAMGEEETLTLEHAAINRRVFARGAIKAAKWLLLRPPGLYKIDDILITV